MNRCISECELTPEQMMRNLPDFLTKILALASDIGIDLASYQADHIALRINEQSLAQEAHQLWLQQGTCISNTTINGRPIIVIELDHQIVIQYWHIECIELPYPAINKHYSIQGWEHIEFVIPSQEETAEGYLADLKEKIPSLKGAWEEMAELGITTKLSAPKGNKERVVNPTVAFKRDGICIKLHPHSLKEVVTSEYDSDNG